MDDTQDRHIHYDDKGRRIYLSGIRTNNQSTKSRYQVMQERYHKALQWEIEHSRNGRRSENYG